MEAAISTSEINIQKQHQKENGVKKMEGKPQKSRSLEGSLEDVRKRQKLDECTDNAVSTPGMTGNRMKL